MNWVIAAAVVAVLAGAVGLVVVRRVYRIRHQPTFPVYRPGLEAVRWGNLARHERDPEATDILPVLDDGAEAEEPGGRRA